jgi:hypothetical protein
MLIFNQLPVDFSDSFQRGISSKQVPNFSSDKNHKNKIYVIIIIFCGLLGLILWKVVLFSSKPNVVMPPGVPLEAPPLNMLKK